MFENYYFILGVVSNIFLILIFLLARSSKMSRLKSVGTAYLALSVPAAYIIIMLGLFILQLTANILSHTKSRITN